MTPATTGDDLICLECEEHIRDGEDRVVTDGGPFCRICFDHLAAHVHAIVAAQGRGISYSAALAGALIGGIAGAAVWWAFTVFTNIAFGLVAVVIGIAVGKGAVLATGGKRSRELQVLSVTVTALSYLAACYYVTRSLVMAAGGGELPLVPDLATAVAVLREAFDVADLIFLAIAAWEAWRIPAPPRLFRTA